MTELPQDHNQAEKPDTDQMIAALCNDLKPVDKFIHPLHMAIGLSAGVLFYVGCVSLIMGCRKDLAEKFVQPMFLFEIGFVLLIGFCSMLAACWLRYPDGKQQRLIQSVPVALICAFFIWVVLRFKRESYAWVTESEWWRYCFTEAFLVGFLPALAVVLVLRRSATIAPVRMMTMAMVAITALGWVGLRSTCGMDYAAQVFVVQNLPFVLAGGVAAMLAKRLFKW